MNKWILRLLAGVAVTQVGATANAAVSPDEEAWKHTEAVNTFEAYAKFSMEFPQSQFAPQARSRLTTLATPGADPEVRAAIDARSAAVMPELVPNSIMIV